MRFASRTLLFYVPSSWRINVGTLEEEIHDEENDDLSIYASHYDTSNITFGVT